MASKPRVLNKYISGIPKDAIYIGRGSKWGNPFLIGTEYNGVILDRMSSIACYRSWLEYSNEGQKLLADAKIALKGKDLVCFCAPKPCHGHVLLELVNNID